MLTSSAEDRLVDEAIAAGAQGYLLKEIDARGRAQAIRDGAAGRAVLDPQVTARVLSRARGGPAQARGDAALDALSPQERRVLALLAKGGTNKEIASGLGLSEKTVKNYLSTIFEKLHVSRRAEAAAIFAQSLPRPDNATAPSGANGPDV
jgi:DNA-binding NarL/FixJ family response regulator